MPAVTVQSTVKCRLYADSCLEYSVYVFCLYPSVQWCANPQAHHAARQVSTNRHKASCEMHLNFRQWWQAPLLATPEWHEKQATRARTHTHVECLEGEREREMKGGMEGRRECVCLRETEMETECVCLCVREIDMHSPVRIVRMPIKEGAPRFIKLVRRRSFIRKQFRSSLSLDGTHQVG